MSNWSIVFFWKLFLYKVDLFTKDNLSDQAEDHHAANCRGTFPKQQIWRRENVRWGENNYKNHWWCCLMERERESEKKKSQQNDLRLSVKADALVTEPMRMQKETGCCCGWCLLPAGAAKSVSLFAGQDLGSDSTFLPHGRNHGDLRRERERSSHSRHARVDHGETLPSHSVQGASLTHFFFFLNIWEL